MALKNDLINLYESQYVEMRRNENLLLSNIRERMLPFIMENYEVLEFQPLEPDNLFNYRFTNLIKLIIDDLSGNVKYYKRSLASCEEIIWQLEQIGQKKEDR